MEKYRARIYFLMEVIALRADSREHVGVKVPIN